jgi:hypothetical protein
MSTAALTTVTEAEADGSTAAIFADIRETMGIALVNLIWRHLAVSPQALAWAWHSLKPLYASDAIPQAAWALRQTLAVPGLSAFSEQDLLSLGDEINDLTLIDAVLRTYERGNAQNLVALSALRSALRNADSSAQIADQKVPAIASASADQDGDHADRVTETLPPLPAMAQLSAPLRADVESLAQVWVPAEYHGMIPSVFRHLSYWPMLLKIYRTKLCELPPGSIPIAELAVRAIHEASAYSHSLAAQLDPPAPLEPEIRDWLSAALDRFIDGMIARGVVIVPAMRKALPSPVSQTTSAPMRARQ